VGNRRRARDAAEVVGVQDDVLGDPRVGPVTFGGIAHLGGRHHLKDRRFRPPPAGRVFCVLVNDPQEIWRLENSRTTRPVNRASHGLVVRGRHVDPSGLFSLSRRMMDAVTTR
jgi:hypothetical protein